MKKFLLLLAFLAAFTGVKFVDNSATAGLLFLSPLKNGIQWSPSSEPLIAWFKTASDYNGTNWADSGPNSYNATLIGTGAAPTVVTNVLNGQPVVRFTGAKYFQFAGANTLVGAATPYAVVIVMKAPPLMSGNYYGLISLRTGANSQQFMYIQNFSSTYQMLDNGGAAGNPGGSGLGIPTLDYSTDFIAIAESYNGASGFNTIANWSARINNIPKTLLQDTGANNSVNGDSVFGALDSSGDGVLSGDIAEIIIFARLLDNETYGKLNAYLYGKYALGTVPTQWKISDIPGLFSWHDSNNVVDDGSGNASFITDLSGNKHDVDCTTGGGPPTAGKPPIVANQLNSQPALDMSSGTAGGGMLSPVTFQPDVNTPFSLSWVVKPAALTSTSLTALLQMAGPDNANSFTIYYANTSSLVPYNLTIEIGDTTPSYVGVTSPFSYTSAHSVILNYNGGGSYNNPANFEIYINGTSVPISQQNLFGSNAQLNWLGNQGDPPGVGIGQFFNMVTVKAHTMGPSVRASLLTYYLSKYGI